MKKIDKKGCFELAIISIVVFGIIIVPKIVDEVVNRDYYSVMGKVVTDVGLLCDNRQYVFFHKPET